MTHQHCGRPPASAHGRPRRAARWLPRDSRAIARGNGCRREDDSSRMPLEQRPQALPSGVLGLHALLLSALEGCLPTSPSGRYQVSVGWGHPLDRTRPGQPLDAGGERRGQAATTGPRSGYVDTPSVGFDVPLTEGQESASSCADVLPASASSWRSHRRCSSGAVTVDKRGPGRAHAMPGTNVPTNEATQFVLSTV